MKNNRKAWISCRVTDFEKEHIASKAKWAGVSPAEYIRSLALNVPLKSIVDQNALDQLIKSRADFGRVGGLLKMALVNKTPLSRSKEDVEKLLLDIEDQAMKLLSISEKLL